VSMRSFAVLVAVVALSPLAQAHLCNNIYRTPDRVIVKPEKDVATLETGDQFRIFVLNNYPTRLHNVRLLASMDAPGVTATITPQSFPELIPGRKEAFQVSITAEAGAPQGRHAMQLLIAADNLGLNNAGKQDVREHSLDEIAVSLQDGNPSSRLMGAETLARRGDQRGVDELSKQINGSDGRSYIGRALHAAGMTGNQACVDLVMPKVQGGDGWERGLALIALGLLQAQPDVIKGYLQENDAFTRVAAHTAYVLCGKADKAITDFLATQLDANDAWARCAAAWGSAYAGNADALPVLDGCFASPDADLVVFAGDALISVARKQEGQTNAGLGELAPDDQAVASAESALKNAPPDRVVIKPRLPIPNCAQGGVVEVQVQHSYPAPLHNVKVSVEGAGVELVAPGAAIDALKPTQLGTVSLTVKATGQGDTVPATFLVSADELAQPARYELSLPLTDAAADRANLAEATPVGDIQVRVMRFGDFYGWLYATPLLLIVGAVVYRWRRHARA